MRDAVTFAQKAVGPLHGTELKASAALAKGLGDSLAVGPSASLQLASRPRDTLPCVTGVVASPASQWRPIKNYEKKQS